MHKQFSIISAIRPQLYFYNLLSLLTTSHLPSVTKAVKNYSSQQYTSLFAPTTYPYYDLNGSRVAMKNIVSCFIVKGNIDIHTHSETGIS